MLSNRSLAHIAMEQYNEALKDSVACCHARPFWAKVSGEWQLEEKGYRGEGKVVAWEGEKSPWGLSRVSGMQYTITQKRNNRENIIIECQKTAHHGYMGSNMECAVQTYLLWECKSRSSYGVKPLSSYENRFYEVHVHVWSQS